MNETRKTIYVDLQFILHTIGYSKPQYISKIINKFYANLLQVISGSSAASSWQLGHHKVLHLIQSPPSRLLLNPGTYG